MLEKVQETIATHDMLYPKDRVLVACSGGGDSMALLHILRELGYEVEAAHVDHGLRGEESAVDCAFVRAECARFHVPCHVRMVDVRKHAAATGESIEVAARELRYAFFMETAAERGIEALATGHTIEDQAETLLMRLMHGAGTAGLAGIPATRQEDDVLIIRPLIDCRRANLRDWLRNKGLTWREDATNEDTGIPRNYVRHVLLPNIAAATQPRIVEVLARTAETLRVDQDYLEAITESALGLCIDTDELLLRDEFRELPEAIQRRVMQRWLWELGATPDHDTLLRCIEFALRVKTGRKFDAGNGVLLYAGKKAIEPASQGETTDTATLPIPGTVRFGGREFTASLYESANADEAAAQCTPLRQVFDADALGSEVLLRTRIDGDRFTPLGMAGSRKLQDYFVDRGVPVPARARTPLVVAGKRIAWVVGHAPGEAFALTATTRTVAEIRVGDAPE